VRLTVSNKTEERIASYLTGALFVIAIALICWGVAEATPYIAAAERYANMSNNIVVQTITFTGIAAFSVAVFLAVVVLGFGHFPALHKSWAVPDNEV